MVVGPSYPWGGEAAAQPALGTGEHTWVPEVREAWLSAAGAARSLVPEEGRPGHASSQQPVLVALRLPALWHLPAEPADRAVPGHPAEPWGGEVYLPVAGVKPGDSSWGQSMDSARRRWRWGHEGPEVTDSRWPSETKSGLKDC